MKNIYTNILQFKGTWRTYQERVLENSQKYLSDKKIHIVAAPGSGKTTLGIELIRRLGMPCLILSPSITIRQQWLERIREGFMTEDSRPDEIVSNDLRNMRSITAVTYQALYSAMKHYHGELESDEAEEGESQDRETVDFTGFDIFAAVKSAGIGTICLDEAHHLRSEWWKALEKFMKAQEGLNVIALTATPPYDSTPGQWKRYIDLCGPIDEEIFTPELVREGSLCPHEDYIYFSWPTREELDEIKAYQKKTDGMRHLLLTGEKFTRMVASHRGLQEPEAYSETFLDHPKYFSALLIFCQAQGIPLPQYLRELIGTDGKLPKLDDTWLEILLQGFLYDDTDSYQVSDEERQQLIKELKEAGCIYRGKVSLTHRDALQKLLVRSQGKMESIAKIADAEYQSMGGELRLLILCDYIKKEKLPLVGTDKEMRAGIGAVPIFEFLRRRQSPGMRLGCLSGSVILVPADTKEKLEEFLKKKGCAGTLLPIGSTGYGRLQVKGKNSHVVAAVTELFRQGEINVLIGTKSLLGEGWDAPCVNSLILATYVGSFMLSNQMRGRTIRTDREHPDKTGNIWHLACIFPTKEGKAKHADFSGDYETLVRRFDAFLGVSWKEDVIESGIGRLDIPEIAKYGVRLFRFGTPQRRMKMISQAIADALIEIGELEDPGHCRVETESADGMMIRVWLKGGTMRDRTAFACCMEELWGVIDNPRYLLMRQTRSGRTDEYYAVPEVFGKQKERAAVFEKHMRRALGVFQIVYTRTPEGRKILLRARTKSFVNKNQEALLEKKVARGKYE